MNTTGGREAACCSAQASVPGCDAHDAPERPRESNRGATTTVWAPPDPASFDHLAEPERAHAIAATVIDPEVPVLTIADLGVLRRVDVDGERVRVTLTPTYSGCPAIEQMRDDVLLALTAGGYDDVVVDFTLSPAWTTDWMSEAGKRKLTEYGIAPPGARPADGPIPLQLGVKCPRCASLRTRELARFGSTACKALFECLACQEPFDHFKVH